MTAAPPAATHGSFFKRQRPFLGFSAVAEVPSAADHDQQPQALNHSGLATSRRRDSGSISSLQELKSSFRRRSASLRSKRPDSPPGVNLAQPHPGEKRSASSAAVRPTLAVTTSPPSRQRSAESIDHHLDTTALRPYGSAVETRPARRLPFAQGARPEDTLPPPPGTAPSSFSRKIDGTGRSTALASHSPSGTNTPTAIYKHIQDIAAKRISTLEYLRKAHEGKVYWFNALKFTYDDLLKMPYFDPRRLARRAANYLMLGVSIPAIMDPNSNNAVDYLRAFGSLLAEFEAYQQVHPADGPPSSSSRARIPQMFKRSTYSVATKGPRRTSGADALSPGSESHEPRSASSAHPSSSSFNSILGSDQELLPGEEYTFLLTPSLPFEPDYFETFVTLCELLVDCYSRIMGLLSSPDLCVPGINELFAKADSKVRKILIAGLVRDFEQASKDGIKSELAGIARITLGGLM